LKNKINPINDVKTIFTALFCVVLFGQIKAQYELKPIEGYTPQIGIIVDMLKEIKDLIESDVIDLNLDETDFLFDEQANSIGVMLMHIAAAEAYIQTETLEGRTWTDEEQEFWSIAGGLGAESRDKIKGKPISYYL